MNDLISVIVPIYNVEKYLSKCIESILNQTYRNFELILVNDGSIDKSSTICEHYKSIDNRVKYYSKKNGGLSSARNYGIDRSKGKYICFIDSDDYIYPNYLRLLYENAIKFKSDITACTYYVDSNNEFIEKHFSDTRTNPRIISSNQFWDEFYFKQNKKDNGFGLVVAWNKLYDRNLFKKYRYKNRFLEDEGIIHYLVNFSERICLIESPSYFYNYQRQDSITSNLNKNSSKRWLCATKIFINRTNFFIKNKYSIEIIKTSSRNFTVVFSKLNYAHKLFVFLLTDMFFLKVVLRRCIDKNTVKIYLKSRFCLLYKLYKLFN